MSAQVDFNNNFSSKPYNFIRRADATFHRLASVQFKNAFNTVFK